MSDNAGRGRKRKRPAARRKGGASGSAGVVEPEPVVDPASEPRTRPFAEPEIGAEASDAEGSEHAASSEIEDQLYQIERRLERLMHDADSVAADPTARRRAADALSQIAARLAAQAGEPEWRPAQPSADTAGRADGRLRHWGRMTLRDRSEEIDGFGLDPSYDKRVGRILEMLYRRYFRVQVEGVDNVPAGGRALLVANHGGAMPWDGIMLKTAMRLEHPQRRQLRWLTEDVVFHMPFVGSFLNRLGAVRACQDNAERLVSAEEAVAVFPEGIKGIGKPYGRRYELQRFGRGGHVKLALRTGTPLIPVAIVGSEETTPILFKVKAPRGMGLPPLPITPTFPWLGPLGLVPLPARWRIVIGAPIDVAEYGPQAADDALLVNRLNEEIRSTIQSTIDETLAHRGSIFFG